MTDDIILQFKKQYLDWSLLQSYLLFLIYCSFFRHKIIHRKADLNWLLNCCWILSDKSSTEQIIVKTKHKPVSPQHIFH